MGVLRSAATVTVAGVVLLLNPAGALAGDDLRVNPRTVQPGEVVTLSLGCQDFTDAYATSDAFGEVKFDGDSRVDVTVTKDPGRYRVRGRCDHGGEWVSEDAWLRVERAGLDEGGFGDGDGDEDGDGVCGVFEDCEELEPWPDFGPATGGGATALRTVSPQLSVGVGVGVVGVVAIGVALVRRRIGARRP
ncbi:hypothetical protein [Streptosporangium sp. KLBMP 9127]|nr:hypothetical protein [Streptosporangium sp. KLBMP 9127]